MAPKSLLPPLGGSPLLQGCPWGVPVKCQMQKIRTKSRFQCVCAWAQSKVITYFCVWPCYPWNPLVRHGCTLLLLGKSKFCQSTQGSCSRIMSHFPWMIKRSHDNPSHLCISLLFPASTAWLFPSENNNALSEEIKISRSSAAPLCFWQLIN